MVYKYLFLILFTLNASEYKDAHGFIDSYVDHYDFKVDGRYTHEYHPFILKKTVNSLYELRDRLKSEGFSLDGHILVTGYEGGAIPSYYTDFTKIKINDEMSSKSKVGWSIKLHNYFGLMTGFLFKDFNALIERWFPNKEIAFQHISPDSVEIFNDQSGFFQKHAFQGSTNYILDQQFEMEKKLKKQDWSGIYKQLVSYWEVLYRKEAKIFGDRLAATQDILFSIDYAKYLLNSDLPIMKFYIGGDITYPIEQSVKQGVKATANAQKFVEILVQNLKPRNGNKTVYVFNSFVDGVGKSTMLGNVKNWRDYGSNVSKYERVDNSSSQWAEVFKFSEDVYIADLPAQMSHFTYKPDGLVYVDIETEKKDVSELKDIREHVRLNVNTYLEKYEKLCLDIINIYKNKGPLAEELNDPNSSEKTFIRNLLLLGKMEQNIWIPFDYKGKKYLFNSEYVNEIRVLKDLANAASHGLKNIESEQMLFYYGVRFPVLYSKFLDDLVGKLKENGVKDVIFVDFLSMYPRSSRENIRVNYLLQQLAMLDNKFRASGTLYKNFINPSELYANLIDKKQRSELFVNFKREVIVRYILFKLLERSPSQSLEGLSFHDITKCIANELTEIYKNTDTIDFLNKKSQLKFRMEINALEEAFGLKKEFVNVQQFSFDLLNAFSSIMDFYLRENIPNKDLNNLWEGMDGNIIGKEEYPQFRGQVFEDKIILNFDTGIDFWVHYCFPRDNKEVNFLDPCFRALRSNWYASLGNILFMKEMFNVVPMVVKQSPTYPDWMYIGQKNLSSWTDDAPESLRKFNLFYSPMDDQWGKFNNKPYYRYWNEAWGANYGIYGFGMPRYKPKTIMDTDSLLVKVLLQYYEDNGEGLVLPTSVLYDRLCSMPEWQQELNKNYNIAKKSGYYNGQRLKTNKLTSKEEIYLGRPDMVPAAQLFVRAIATLEMILKDIDSDVVVRKGNRKDFKAALKLIEQIVMPKYYGILFEESLFKDYNAVEPLISWEFFED